MYRRATMIEQQQITPDQFVTRFGSLPVVTSAWGHACDMYQRTKDRNILLRTTCNLAECGVQTAVATTKPLVDRYQPQIEQVNTYACEKLALVEENYPIITRPTDEVLTESKEKCLTIVRPVTDTVCNTYNGIKNKGQQTVDAAMGKVVAVKDYGLAQVNRGLGTPMGMYALEKVHEALTTSDGYIEKYLPAAGDDEGAQDGDNQNEAGQLQDIDVRTLQGTATRVHALSTKLRRRMYKRAMHDLQGFRMRSKERIDNFNFTVDLIQYAKSGATYAKSSAVDMKETLEEKYLLAQHKVSDVWAQINDNPHEAPETPSTIEGITIAVARRMVFEIKQDVSIAATFIRRQAHPQVVMDRLETAYKFMEEMASSLAEKCSWGEVSYEESQQWRGRVNYVDDAVEGATGVCAVAFGLFGRSVGLLPLSGAITDRSGASDLADGEDMEMEPLDAAADTSKSEDDSDRSE